MLVALARLTGACGVDYGESCRQLGREQPVKES